MPRASTSSGLYRKNGDIRHVLITVDLIPGTTQTVASLIDITDRRLADEQLLQREQQYRFIADNSLDIITRLSTDFICLYVSPAITPLLGYSEMELLGKYLLALIHPEDLEQSWNTLDAIVRSGSAQLTLTFRLRHKDGHYSWFESTVRIIRDEKTGRVREYLCISRDITARKCCRKGYRWGLTTKVPGPSVACIFTGVYRLKRDSGCRNQNDITPVNTVTRRPLHLRSRPSGRS